MSTSPDDDAVGVGGKSESRRAGARLERAIAQVAVEDVGVVEPSEDEVDAAVAVEIARRDAAGEEGFAREVLESASGSRVDMRDAGAGGDVGEHDGQTGERRGRRLTAKAAAQRRQLRCDRRRPDSWYASQPCYRRTADLSRPKASRSESAPRRLAAQIASGGAKSSKPDARRFRYDRAAKI